MNSSNIDPRNSIDRSLVVRAFLLIAVALACFALSPMADAVSPAPDGGYPGANTAEGTDALFSLTSSGTENTAVGFGYLPANVPLKKFVLMPMPNSTQLLDVVRKCH